jgi:hypothetical protein
MPVLENQANSGIEFEFVQTVGLPESERKLKSFMGLTIGWS